MTTTNQTMPGMDEYRTTMDDLRFSDEAKARMTARLVEAATVGQPAAISTTSPRTHRRSRLPIAAAMAALALTLGLGGIAYAAGGFMNVPRFVSHLFGGGDAKVEIVDKVGRPVGIAQSSNGVTVSVDAIIGDRTNVAVVFSIAKDDGTPFEGIEALDNGLLPLGFSENLEVRLPLLSGWGATGSSYFYDEDPADNAIQLVETRSFESDGSSDISLVGRTMTAHFSDLKLYGNGEPIVIAPGSWDLSFPLDYEDASIDLPVGQTFSLDAFTEDDVAQTREEVTGIQATIDELQISPIALHVSYTANQKVEWTSGESGRESEHDSRLADVLLGVDMTVTLRDGTILEVSENTGGSIDANEEQARCETGFFFDRILDLDEVASITIGGTTIEL